VKYFIFFIFIIGSAYSLETKYEYKNANYFFYIENPRIDCSSTFDPDFPFCYLKADIYGKTDFNNKDIFSLWTECKLSYTTSDSKKTLIPNIIEFEEMVFFINSDIGFGELNEMIVIPFKSNLISVNSVSCSGVSSFDD